MYKDGEIEPTTDIMEWSKWFSDADRRLYVDKIGTREVVVSTVFLGLDHGFYNSNVLERLARETDDSECEPVLFETMVFGGPYDGETWRYASEIEARLNHRRVVAKVADAEMKNDMAWSLGAIAAVFGLTALFLAILA